MAASAYIRMSTDDQALSPDAQRAAITAWSKRTGVVVDVEHADLGVSGAAGLDKRPGLLAAIDSLGRGDVLVVAKRDRLGRDALLLAMVEASVARKGARIVSAAGEGTDGDDPTQVLMRRIVDAFAEYERLIIKARTRSALAVKRERGERTGSVPYGFALAVDRVRLVLAEHEQAVIREARAMRDAGRSLREIAAELDARGIRARNGARFAATQIARMISSAERPLLAA
jgi:DNA invertase Pin-like site-specific DNA recombinase